MPAFVRAFCVCVCVCVCCSRSVWRNWKEQGWEGLIRKCAAMVVAAASTEVEWEAFL